MELIHTVHSPLDNLKSRADSEILLTAYGEVCRHWRGSCRCKFLFCQPCDVSGRAQPSPGATEARFPHFAGEICVLEISDYMLELLYENAQPCRT
jgi:hypothetical protein